MNIQVSKACLEFVRRKAGNFVAQNDAPDTWEALQESAQGKDPRTMRMVVWSGESKGTIFGRPEDNHAFRAWHDRMHLIHGIGFTVSDEIEVAKIQMRQMKCAGLPDVDRRLILWDVGGQAKFHAYHGEFVKDQQRFVEFCESFYAARSEVSTRNRLDQWSIERWADNVGFSYVQ